MHIGGDSGQVHSTVKQRWQDQDPALIQGMKQLGQLADLAQEAIENSHYSLLTSYIAQNFALRRQLYGDDVVGKDNILVVELLERYLLIGKFTGSGGAIVCMRADEPTVW